MKQSISFVLLATAMGAEQLISDCYRISEPFGDPVDGLVKLSDMPLIKSQGNSMD
jgi:hypothetical protein